MPVSDVERSLADLERRATTQSQIAQSASDLIALAETNGLKSLSPAPTPSVSGHDAKLGPIELVGSFSAFQAYFRALAARPRIAVLDSVTLRQANADLAAQGFTTQATLTAREYVLADAPSGASGDERVREIEGATAALTALSRLQPRPTRLLDSISRHLPVGEIVLDEVSIRDLTVTIRGAARNADAVEKLVSAMNGDNGCPIGDIRVQQSPASEKSEDELSAPFTIVSTFKP